MKRFLARGFVVGSSLGVLLALGGFSDSMGRAFIVGGIGGILAGYTLWKRSTKK